MTIITSKSKAKQLPMELFARISKWFLKKKHNLIIEFLLQTIKNDTIKSSYKSCAQMLKANGMNSKSTFYNEAFTALNKLGLILKHDNVYHLHPLVEAKYTSKRYELVIDYYRLLFHDASFNFEVYTLDELKRKAVRTYLLDLQERNQAIHDNNLLWQHRGEPHYYYQNPLSIPTFDEAFEIAFLSRPKSLPQAHKAIYKTIWEHYRNHCSDQITNLVIEHMHIMEDQGVLTVGYERHTGIQYAFNKLTKDLQKNLVHYNQTQYYQDLIPSPDTELIEALYSDMMPKLKEEFECQDQSIGPEQILPPQPITAEEEWRELFQQEIDDFRYYSNLLFNQEQLPTIQQKLCHLHDQQQLDDESQRSREENFINDLDPSSLHFTFDEIHLGTNDDLYYKVWLANDGHHKSIPEFPQELALRLGYRYYHEVRKPKLKE
ncbi:MAG: hypothetical protein AAGE96_14440 [Cyanobacteria bacterium P01_G01_bin.19]